MITANFVFKLHAAALEALGDGVTLYPVMDGLYIATPSRSALEGFLRTVLTDLAEGFIGEDVALHRFIVKGAIAFGPVIHGRDVPAECNRRLGENDNYRRQLLLGAPMVQAHESERLAPPFGVFVHESARTFSPPDTEVFRNTWWPWLAGAAPLRAQLWTRLNDHFQWCEDHSRQLLYEGERIKVHRAMAAEFFQAAPLFG
jgi:hypothetical protein